MRVDFDQKLKTLDGKGDLIDGDTNSPLLLKRVAAEALLAEYEGEKLTGEEKHKRYNIAVKTGHIKDDFTIDELKLIKDLIGKSYPPLIVGQAFNMLEGK